VLPVIAVLLEMAITYEQGHLYHSIMCACICLCNAQQFYCV